MVSKKYARGKSLELWLVNELRKRNIMAYRISGSGMVRCDDFSFYGVADVIAYASNVSKPIIFQCKNWKCKFPELRSDEKRRIEELMKHHNVIVCFCYKYRGKLYFATYELRKKQMYFESLDDLLKYICNPSNAPKPKRLINIKRIADKV